LAIDGFPKNVLLNDTPQDGEIDPKFFEDVDIKKLGTLKLCSKMFGSFWIRIWILVCPGTGDGPSLILDILAGKDILIYTQYMKP